jgi:hypothetical protein
MSRATPPSSIVRWIVGFSIFITASLGTPGSARVPSVTLRDDGINQLRFGDSAATVIDAMNNLLGKPTFDSGWHPEQIGCDQIGVNIRDIQWAGLNVELSSGPTQYGPAKFDHFILYEYTADKTKRTVKTNKGLQVGFTVANLKRLYPRVILSNSEIEGPVYRVGNGISGNLSSLSNSGKVVSIRSGLLCID